MELPVDLAALSRGELIGLVGRLLSHIEALEARIAELEGQLKPPTDAGKKPKPPSQGQPDRQPREESEFGRPGCPFLRRGSRQEASGTGTEAGPEDGM